MSSYYPEKKSVYLYHFHKFVIQNKVKDNIEDNIILKYIYYTGFLNLSIFTAGIFTCIYLQAFQILLHWRQDKFYLSPCKINIRIMLSSWPKQITSLQIFTE